MRGARIMHSAWRCGERRMSTWANLERICFCKNYPLWSGKNESLWTSASSVGDNASTHFKEWLWGWSGIRYEDAQHSAQCTASTPSMLAVFINIVTMESFQSQWVLMDSMTCQGYSWYLGCQLYAQKNESRALDSSNSTFFTGDSKESVGFVQHRDSSNFPQRKALNEVI